MDNEKLFNDIFMEAHAAQILAEKIRDGSVPLKEIKATSQQIQNHMENIMAAKAYREDHHG